MAQPCGTRPQSRYSTLSGLNIDSASSALITGFGVCNAAMVNGRTKHSNVRKLQISCNKESNMAVTSTSQACDLIIFGAKGDLARGKLLPSLTS